MITILSKFLNTSNEKKKFPPQLKINVTVCLPLSSSTLPNENKTSYRILSLNVLTTFVMEPRMQYKDPTRGKCFGLPMKPSKQNHTMTLNACSKQLTILKNIQLCAFRFSDQFPECKKNIR